VPFSPEQSEQNGRPDSRVQRPFPQFPDIFDNPPEPPPQPTRREEITNLISHQSKNELSQKDKKNIGEWLQNRSSKILRNGADNTVGIAANDLIENYSADRWSDGTKFLRADRRMMKEVAKHFDEIALAGKSAKVIEDEDVDGLVRGAKVKRTEVEVTSTFPDGSLARRTQNGDLLKKGADGSLSFQSAAADLDLPASGTGHLKFTLNGMQSQEIKLTKRPDGVWTGDLDGSEIELAIDEHSVRLTTSDMDMLLTTNGGFVRDPSNPKFGATFINRDGSVSMNDPELGSSAEIAKSKDGIVLAQVSDGSREVQYPFDAILVNDGKGNIRIKSKGLIPDLASTADGELTIFHDATSTSAKPGADGNTVIKLESGMTVTRQKEGNIVVSTPIEVDPAAGFEHDLAVQFTFSPDGTLTISTPFGDPMVLHPPEIKRPK
jgi:hypothetical protein